MVKRTDKLAVCHEKSTPETDLRCTPRAFFEYVQKQFNVKFTLDIAASKKNTLCKKFIDKKMDALVCNWTGLAWCNPPYSLSYEFVEQCYGNSNSGNGSTFMLLAARTDQDWWHEFVSKAWAVVYIKGRIKFKGAAGGAPFPSVLVIFKKGFKGETKNFYASPTPYERGFDRKTNNRTRAK